jgi:hypothetical protein
MVVGKAGRGGGPFVGGEARGHGPGRDGRVGAPDDSDLMAEGVSPGGGGRAPGVRSFMACSYPIRCGRKARSARMRKTAPATTGTTQFPIVRSRSTGTEAPGTTRRKLGWGGPGRSSHGLVLWQLPMRRVGPGGGLGWSSPSSRAPLGSGLSSPAGGRRGARRRVGESCHGVSSGARSLQSRQWSIASGPGGNRSASVLPEVQYPQPLHVSP